jgi:hypothetical protein
MSAVADGHRRSALTSSVGCVLLRFKDERLYRILNRLNTKLIFLLPTWVPVMLTGYCAAGTPSSASMHGQIPMPSAAVTVRFAKDHAHVIR